MTSVLSGDVIVSRAVWEMLWRQQMAVGNVTSTKHHRKIVKMMVVVLGLFIPLAVTWHLQDIVLDMGVNVGRLFPAQTQLVTREVGTLLIFVNGWALPIVYASFHAGVKKRVTSMLTCGSALYRVYQACDVWIGPVSLEPCGSGPCCCCGDRLQRRRRQSGIG